MNSLQCSACQATLDHTNINYFELFGLKPSFDLDITKIVSKYHNLQILYHPDKHSSDNKVSLFSYVNLLETSILAVS